MHYRVLQTIKGFEELFYVQGSFYTKYRFDNVSKMESNRLERSSYLAGVQPEGHVEHGMGESCLSHPRPQAVNHRQVHVAKIHWKSQAEVPGMTKLPRRWKTLNKRSITDDP